MKLEIPLRPQKTSGYKNIQENSEQRLENLSKLDDKYVRLFDLICLFDIDSTLSFIEKQAYNLFKWWRINESW